MGLEELRALLPLLREHGVVLYRAGDVELHLDPAALPQSPQPTQDASQDIFTPGSLSGLTHEQLMFYSAGAGPQDDGDEEPA